MKTKFLNRLISAVISSAMMFTLLGSIPAAQTNPTQFRQAFAVEPGASEEFLGTVNDASYCKVYDKADLSSSFNMAGETFYQGITLHNTYGYSSNTATGCFNVEDIDKISFTYGHLDNTNMNDATLDVYVDDKLFDKIELDATGLLKEYTLDVSKASTIRFSASLASSTGYGLGDFTVDNKAPAMTRTVPKYKSAEEFIASQWNSSYYSTYDGSSKFNSYNMAGEIFYQGIILHNTYGYSSNTSTGYLNVENINTISFTYGHLDNTNMNDATLDVYVDDKLFDKIELDATGLLKKYTLDVSKASTIQFSVSLAASTGYGLGDFTVDNKAPAMTRTIPEYKSAEEFIASQWNSSYYSSYDGSSKFNSYNMAGETFYQGITLHNTYGYSSNSATGYLNVENIDEISFTYGHIDETNNNNATLEIYVDDQLFDKVELEATSHLKAYVLDVSKASTIQFYVSLASSTGYGLADVKIVPRTAVTPPQTTTTTTTTTTASTTKRSTTTTTATSTKPQTTTTKNEDPNYGSVIWGDANCDGAVSFKDYEAIVNYLTDSDKYPLSPMGRINADVYHTGDGVTFNDAKAIWCWIMGYIDTLPTEGPLADIEYPTVTPSKEPDYGDADCDGKVQMNDAVLIMQVLSNADRFGENGTDKNRITASGMKNADCHNPGSGITPNDALAVQTYLLKMNDLPLKK